MRNNDTLPQWDKMNYLEKRVLGVFYLLDKFEKSM